MRARGDELGDRVRECTLWCDMEDWIGVFAIVHATFGEDDCKEVNAGGVEQGER